MHRGSSNDRPTSAELAADMRAIPLFAGLDGDTLDELAGQARWRRYDTGEVVVREGTPATGLYHLSSGWLKVVKSSTSGREQILRFLETGDTFNAVGVFTGEPAPATVVALAPAAVWWLPRDTLVGLLRRRPDFAEHLVAKMAGTILHLVSLVSDISLRTVTGRLARLILDEADGGVLRRPRWYTQTELASRLGTVTDVVQRALRDLDARGLVRVERDGIVVLDRDGLGEIAE